MILFLLQFFSWNNQDLEEQAEFWTRNKDNDYLRFILTAFSASSEWLHHVDCGTARDQLYT